MTSSGCRPATSARAGLLGYKAARRNQRPASSCGRVTARGGTPRHGRARRPPGAQTSTPGVASADALGVSTGTTARMGARATLSQYSSKRWRTSTGSGGASGAVKVAASCTHQRVSRLARTTSTRTTARVLADLRRPTMKRRWFASTPVPFAAASAKESSPYVLSRRPTRIGNKSSAIRAWRTAWTRNTAENQEVRRSSAVRLDTDSRAGRVTRRIVAVAPRRHVRGTLRPSARSTGGAVDDPRS